METNMSYTDAMKRLQEIAIKFNISTAQAADALRNLALTAKETTLIPGDTDTDTDTGTEPRYKTLSYSHEVIKD